jgi:hypothetical protein
MKTRIKKTRPRPPLTLEEVASRLRNTKPTRRTLARIATALSKKDFSGLTRRELAHAANQAAVAFGKKGVRNGSH